MKNLMLDYVHYNLWVNTRLVEMFKDADDELVSHEVQSSFPSIRHTMIHLWDVETLWLSRLKGVSPTTLNKVSLSFSRRSPCRKYSARPRKVFG